MGWLARCIGGLQFSFFVFLLFSNQFMKFTFALIMTPCVALYVAMMRHKGLARDSEDAVPEEQPVTDRDSVTAGGRRDLAEPVYPRAPRHARLAAAGRGAISGGHGPRQLEAPSGGDSPSGGSRASENTAGLGTFRGQGTAQRYVFDPDVPTDGVQAVYDEEDEEDDTPDPDQGPQRRRR
jgi:hypothetical protein